MIYFICIIHLHIFHGNIWTQNWPAPNVSGFIAQLVERRTGIARSRVQAPLKSRIFFRLLYAVAKIAIITARIILHLISYPQFTYDLFHMHHSPLLLLLLLWRSREGTRLPLIWPGFDSCTRYHTITCMWVKAVVSWFLSSKSFTPELHFPPLFIFKFVPRSGCGPQ